MRPMWVNLDRGCGLSRPTRWGRCGRQAMSAAFLWLHRNMLLHEAVLFSVACVARTCSCSLTVPMRSCGIFKAAYFFLRPTVEVGDTRLRVAGLWGHPNEPCWTGTSTLEPLESSFACARQGILLLRRPDCGRVWRCWSQYFSNTEKVFPGWGFAAGRELRAGVSALRAVHLVS